LVYTSLPEIAPVHFGSDGVANRWADKSELLILAGVVAIFPIINAVLALTIGKYEKGMLLVLGTIFIVVICLVCLYSTRHSHHGVKHALHII
jgi:hypothetical protein